MRSYLLHLGEVSLLAQRAENDRDKIGVDPDVP